MGKIFAIVKAPGQLPETVYIENTLEELQRIVGGYIETYTIASDLVIICNEEGRLMDLPYNCDICGVSFVGTIVLVGVSGESYASVRCPCDIMKLFPQLWKEV